MFCLYSDLFEQHFPIGSQAKFWLGKAPLDFVSHRKIWFWFVKFCYEILTVVNLNFKWSKTKAISPRVLQCSLLRPTSGAKFLFWFHSKLYHLGAEYLTFNQSSRGFNKNRNLRMNSGDPKALSGEDNLFQIRKIIWISFHFRADSHLFFQNIQFIDRYYYFFIIIVHLYSFIFLVVGN